MPTLSQTQSIGQWTTADFDKTNASTDRFSSSQHLDDKELRRSLMRTQAAMVESASAPGSNGFIQLRNKLDQAAHTRTTSLINHEKGQIHRKTLHMHDEGKVLQSQFLLGASELGKLKARAETLRARLTSDREELATVDKHLNMFDSIQGVGNLIALFVCMFV